VNRWVGPETRDDVVRTVERCAARSILSTSALLECIGVSRHRFYDWRRRRSRPNAHNASAPKDGWLAPWEKEAIVAFSRGHPGNGYRRLAYMMMDADVVAASPSSVYRVLREAGLLRGWSRENSKRGKGFEQPVKPHEHWHSDISYVNIAGTFYYFFGLIDGTSRYIVHWEIREAMKEADLEIVIERAKEIYPEARPRIISDNGPQYLAREFREFIRLSGMTHVRTSPYYPQSNGKIERFHGSLKRECIRPRTPVSLVDARGVVGRYVDHYNNERLHSAIGYVAPAAVLEGRDGAIHAARRRKLDTAKRRRKAEAQKGESRDLTPESPGAMIEPAGETETGSAGGQPDRGISGRNTDAQTPAQGASVWPPCAEAESASVLAHA
jgi:putative transposase